MAGSCEYIAYNEDFAYETLKRLRFGAYFGGSCVWKAYEGVFSHEEPLGGGEFLRGGAMTLIPAKMIGHLRGNFASLLKKQNGIP